MNRCYICAKPATTGGTNPVPSADGLCSACAEAWSFRERTENNPPHRRIVATFMEREVPRWILRDSPLLREAHFQFTASGDQERALKEVFSDPEGLQARWNAQWEKAYELTIELLGPNQPWEYLPWAARFMAWLVHAGRPPPAIPRGL